MSSRSCQGLLPALTLLALSLSACGSGVASTAGSHKTTGGSATATRGSGVPAEAAAVIEGWANALRANMPVRAAAYWAHPSVMVNGPDGAGQITLIHILDTRDAKRADETLSCGATLRRTRRSGKYVEGEFTLSSRAGAGASSTGCSGPASVDFLIQGGHIVRWLRAPVASSTPPGEERPAIEGANPQSV